MVPDNPARTSTRLDPETAWTVVTESPLKGFALAREAGSLFAWDDGGQLYLLGPLGDFRSAARSPGKVVAAAVSDDGSRIAILGENSRLWLLDADLSVVAERTGPYDSTSLAIDPHGRYVVVASKSGTNQFFNRFGKPAGKFETVVPLAFLVFVPSAPRLVAAASYGMLTEFVLSAGGSGRLRAAPSWEDRQITGVGRLTTTGDASMILASCFTHGVQRYDAHGQNDGAYHLGGTATHAVPDFAGRVIAVATVEGELSIINAGGNVRWKSGLPRPAVALELDPLGRYLLYGHATGEIVRLDLFPSERGPERPKPAARAASSPPVGATSAGSRVGRGGTVRQPNWTLAVVSSDDRAESAVLTVLDEPSRVGLFASNLKLQIVTAEGRNLGFAPEILGAGRVLRTAPGWIAAATDRQIVLFHASRNAAQRVDLSLVEITNLAIRPDSFGLLIVQERDRVGRATIAGRWVWKQERKSPIEDVAIGPDGYSAISDESGLLTVHDPAGLTAGTFQTEPAETLNLIEALDGAPPSVAWITLARSAQVLRGHDLQGRVLWETPVAWEGWQFHRVGSLAVVVAPDGRVLAFDGSGHLRGQGRASAGSNDLFGSTPRGEPRRVFRQGVHLICSDLDGRVRWRAICDEPIGPFAVGQTGVAALIGRSLAWFSGLD